MEGKLLTTFFIGLCGLPSVCESARYCYSYNYHSGRYFEYRCKDEMTTAERFGIVYGVLTGVSLLVSLVVFLFCKHKQNSSHNHAIVYQTMPSLGHVTAGQQRIIQTTVPLGIINNSTRPTGNPNPSLQTHTPSQESSVSNTRETELATTGPQLNGEASDRPPPYKL